MKLPFGIVSIQQRYVVVAMMFFTLAVVFSLRVSFPIVLTQMVYVPNVNPDESHLTNNVIICPVQNDTESVGKPETVVSLLINNTDRYQWSQKLQGVVLSSFYYGNIFSEIPASILVQRYGAKILLLTSLALSALVTILTPMAVEYGEAYGLIATRVLLGFVQGPIFPCLAAFVVPWYPVEERGRLCSFGYIGISAGAALASFASGLLLHNFGRWDITFYFFTVILVLLWISFAFLCYEKPQDHPFISDEEKEYLQQKIEHYENERRNLSSTPWIAIIKCSPVWALILSTALYSWSFSIINTDLPKYLNDVLHVSIDKNGIYSSVPKILSIIVSTGSGIVSDLLLSKYHIDRTLVRKIFVVLTSIIPATFLMSASYAGCNELLAVIFFTISISAHGFNSVGAAINLYDLAPNYVAPLNAVINSLATFVGLLTPFIAGVLTPNALLSEWRTVFWITFSLHLMESVIFTIFGSAVTQKWNSS
ncbi:sialin-like [Contarinia nasturtii]|uniref:sialin-like n=1 Tax=Contarinia nasturtii TaxID=265458 RepID=UPI0012D3BE83|nr:sialin-like [Contarinia nasturtii]